LPGFGLAIINVVDHDVDIVMIVEDWIARPILHDIK